MNTILRLQTAKSDELLAQEWHQFSQTQCCPYCGNDHWHANYKVTVKNETSWYFKCSNTSCRKTWRSPVKYIGS
jgi:hypothetical protein